MEIDGPIAAEMGQYPPPAVAATLFRMIQAADVVVYTLSLIAWTVAVPYSIYHIVAALAGAEDQIELHWRKAGTGSLVFLLASFVLPLVVSLIFPEVAARWHP